VRATNVMMKVWVVMVTDGDACACLSHCRVVWVRVVWCGVRVFFFCVVGLCSVGKYLKSVVYGGLDGIITTFAIVAGTGRRVSTRARACSYVSACMFVGIRLCCHMVQRFNFFFDYFASVA